MPEIESDVLVLRQTQPSLQTYAISRATQLGRGMTAGEWAVPEREQPPEFDALETIIVLNDISISRNHLAIFRRNGQYVALDLNSLYGSRVDGRNINPDRENPRPVLLGVGNEIRIGPYSMTVEKGKVEHFALLIGAGEDNTGAAENDVDSLARVLSERGYGNVRKMGLDVTKKDVFDYLDDAARIATPESHFLFFFHGHGHAHGIGVGGGIVNPKDLYKRLSRIRGKKAVMIEACNAGIFVNERNVGRIPKHTVVMTASDEGYGAAESLTSSLSQARYHGRMVSAFLKFLRGNPESVDILNFQGELEQGMEGLTRLMDQQPRFAAAGSQPSYTIIGETPMDEICL